MTIKKIVIILIAVIVVLLFASGAWLWYCLRTSNTWNAKTIGEIPAPSGYVRDYAAEGSETAFLRSLPLKPKGSKVKLYTGGIANFQWLAAAVIDIPVLSNYEQCADMTMRLRAEWLFSNGSYSSIRFHTVNNSLVELNF